MESKEQPPPQYSPPQQPPQQPLQQGFMQPPQPVQQGFIQQQQYVVNQSYPAYSNQGFVVQQGFPVQNQVMYTVGSPNVVVTQPTATVIVNQRPSDYFVCSLLTCLFCFFPTGIVALIYSCSSKQASDRNDYIQGRSSGNMAKICSIIGFVIGILWILGVVIFMIVYFTTLNNRRSYNYSYPYDTYNNYNSYFD